MAKLLLEKPDVLLLDELTNFLDKDHVSSLKDSFTKYTSKATTIGRAQGLMQKHFETLRPITIGLGPDMVASHIPFQLVPKLQ